MQAEFAQLLASGDAAAVVRAWDKLFPGATPPASLHEAEIAMHYARTLSRAVPMRARLYSHAWLRERSVPSGLPDHMRAAADRLYPRKVEGVAISSMFVRPTTLPLRGVQEYAVNEVYADHGPHPDPLKVKARMAELRAREAKKLGI